MYLVDKIAQFEGFGYVEPITRSSAVAMTADRNAYDARYSYRPLSGIPMVRVSIYSFAVLN